MNPEPYRMLVIGLSRDCGGVESYIMNMLRAFSRQRLVCYFPANGAEETYGEELEKMGHRFINVPLARGRHFFNYYRGWNRIFREYQFDAIYFNDCSVVHIDLLKLALKYRLPVRIFHAHSSSWMGKGKPLLRYRMMAAWNKAHINSIATSLFACSQASAAWMFPEGSSYRVIHNGIDTQRYAYSLSARKRMREMLGAGEELLIGYIGRFDPEKNPAYFVRVLDELRKLIPDARGVMVGDGELRQEVETAIRDSGLPDGCIQLLGARNDVADIMSALDCLVMPSLVEGFPFVLVEAQAQGLPCIVSDNVASETDLTGLLRFVSLAHPADWADAIERAQQVVTDRGGYAEILREKGYDSRAVFAALEEEIINTIEASCV